MYNWQDYNTFKNYLPLQNGSFDPTQVRWQAAPPYPGWYAWCDHRDGPPNLLLELPNLRGFQNAPGSYDRHDEDEEEPDHDQPAIFRAVPPAPRFHPCPLDRRG